MKNLLILSVLGMLIFAIGCRPGAQVVSLNEIAVTTATQKQASAAEVRKAIIAGCVANGWSAQEVSPGRIEASITVRGKHYVVVEIPYSSKSYSIHYKSSNNMEYNGAKGTIHPNYNNWVNNLRGSIDRQIDTIQL